MQFSCRACLAKEFFGGLMTAFHLTTSLLGLGLALVIVLLIRRDELYMRHALFWLLVALAAAVFGLWPRTLDWIGRWVGVQYSPALALLVGVIVLFIKALRADVANTRLETDLRYIQQSLALLEAEMAVLRTQGPTKPNAESSAPAPKGQNCTSTEHARVASSPLATQTWPAGNER